MIAQQHSQASGTALHHADLLEDRRLALATQQTARAFFVFVRHSLHGGFRASSGCLYLPRFFTGDVLSLIDGECLYLPRFFTGDVLSLIDGECLYLPRFFTGDVLSLIDGECLYLPRFFTGDVLPMGNEFGKSRCDRSA